MFFCVLILLSSTKQWFEVLDGLLGKYWRNVGLAFNCTFLLFGSVIQLIACARFGLQKPTPSLIIFIIISIVKYGTLHGKESPA
jgi:hypothetical protein